MKTTGIPRKSLALARSHPMKGTLAKKLDWEVKIDFDDPFILDAKARQKMAEYVKFLEEGKG